MNISIIVLKHYCVKKNVNQLERKPRISYMFVLYASMCRSEEANRPAWSPEFSFLRFTIYQRHVWPTQRAYTATTKLGFNGKLHRAQAHTRESTPASGSAVCTLDRAIFPPGRRAHDTKETFLARIVLRSCDRRAEFCLCGRLLTRCLALCVLCVVFRGY